MKKIIKKSINRNFSKKIDKKRGFMDYYRNDEPYRPVSERINDWNEINHNRTILSLEEKKSQAARCMDCGTPFCQTYKGCPINNLIPEWNELVFHNQWKSAYERLKKTNNFPEFTGRVCPAPCESSCVLGLNENPVTIKSIEYSIIEKAWEMGWVEPILPQFRTGKKIAIIGSGPTGLSAADQLNQMGYDVTVFEKDDIIGGLLVYGIPNMKLDKFKVERRIKLLESEGITFKTNVNIGIDIKFEEIYNNFDASIIAIGSTVPRNMQIKGRELNGIYYAMDFLTKNQKNLFMTKDGKFELNYKNGFIKAENKDIIIIGGGDTGTDCIATSVRNRCKSVNVFSRLSCPPIERLESNPWPEWLNVFQMDYGHEEALERFGKDPRVYNILTKEFIGDNNNNLKGLITVDVEETEDGIKEIPNSEKEWPADIVLLAMGFLHPEEQLSTSIGLELDKNKNIKSEYGNYTTNIEGVFAAGDCRRGQSLVVWAINEGRDVAEKCHNWLSKKQI